VVFTDQIQNSYNLKAHGHTYFHEHEHSQSGLVHQRAWCYQEYMLATRVISYNDMEIIFSCRSQSTCECQRRYYEVPRPCLALFDSQRLNTSQLLDSWVGILHAYTPLEIKFTTGRLPAISGKSSCFQRATTWTYVAGMWSEESLECMYWLNVGLSLNDSSTSTAGLAPSFSWASITGGVFSRQYRSGKMEL